MNWIGKTKLAEDENDNGQDWVCLENLKKGNWSVEEKCKEKSKIIMETIETEEVLQS